MTDEVRLARAYLSRVAEPASIPVWNFVCAVGPVEAAARIAAGSVEDDDVCAATSVRSAQLDPQLDPHRDLDAAERHGIRLVTPESDDWPHFAMAALEHAGANRAREFAMGKRWTFRKTGEPVPPLALWVRGAADLSVLGVRSVGIVGARAATEYGSHVARSLAAEVAERDVTVISGGAYGIDAAAHRGALDAAGITVLVSAGGLDAAYPSGHDRLYRAVAETGLLVSESPPGSRPQRHRFLTRNRLVAALSTGVIVVEASERSGALNTIGHCHRIGRPIMAVPGPIGSAMSAGCHTVLRSEDYGATLVRSTEDVMQVIGTLSEGTGTAAAPPAPARSRIGRLLDSLDERARLVFDGFPAGRSVLPDEVMIVSGLPVADVLSSLPILENAGLIEASDGGFRIRSITR